MLLITGCGAKEKQKAKEEQEKILGTWEAKYELSVFGEVSETYTFKEEGKCVRVLNAGNDIADNCTYEFNEDKTEIRILWEDKLDQESYSKYIEIDDNTIMIGEHKYEKK